MGRLGALIVEWEGKLFNIGTGFTDAERIDIWNRKEQYHGKQAKFKYLPVGVKDLPRHPVFLGWRLD
jgi:DNA ligase-1